MFLEMFVVVKQLSDDQCDDIRNEISEKAGKVYPHVFTFMHLLYDITILLYKVGVDSAL